MLDDGILLLILWVIILVAVLLANYIINIMWLIHPAHQQSSTRY